MRALPQRPLFNPALSMRQDNRQQLKDMHVVLEMVLELKHIEALPFDRLTRTCSAAAAAHAARTSAGSAHVKSPPQVYNTPPSAGSTHGMAAHVCHKELSFTMFVCAAALAICMASSWAQTSNPVHCLPGARRTLLLFKHLHAVLHCAWLLLGCSAWSLSAGLVRIRL